jgi:excisionase family DNA binding protein
MHPQISVQIPIDEIVSQVVKGVTAQLQQEKEKDTAEKLLTAKETADLLRVSLVTLWDWEKKGRVNKYRMGGRTFFKYSEVMANLETLQRYRKPAIVKALL